MSRYIAQSLGGGLQSSTQLMMSLLGDLPKIDVAIFADTGWERQDTYKNVEMLRDFAEDYGVPVVTVRGHTSVREQAINPKYKYNGNFVHMPIFLKSDRSDKISMSKRQCTSHYKIKPIRKYLRDTFGNSAKFDQWIGITLDEITRMKPSGVKYITNKFPFVEKEFGLRWNRGDCVKWLQDHGLGVPSKSSCIGCPYHSDDTWLLLNEHERHDAIDVDEKLRTNFATSKHFLKPKKTQDEQYELFSLMDYDKLNNNPEYLIKESELKVYLHSRGIPLANFFISPDKYVQPELFNFENQECTGLCFL